MGRRFFGSDPEAYDSARPGHAGEVYEILRERCGLRVGSRVLEVGPGTGQASRRLLELGADPLVALEPDPALASYLRTTLGGKIDVRVEAVEDVGLPSGAFDLAVAASSFHWVEEPVGLAKLFDALRAGRWVALWWTLFGDDERPDPFREAVDHLFDEVPRSPSAAYEDRPSFALDVELRQAALTAAGFEQLEHERIQWARSWDTAAIRTLYSTFSPIGALQPERRRELLDSVARIADLEFGGVVQKPLVTSLYTARKPS